MNNIIIGSIVLCKIIITDPNIDNASNKQEVNQQAAQQQSYSGANQQLGNIIGAIAKTGSNEVGANGANQEKVEVPYSLIQGTVESIKDEKYLKEIPGLNKYKYEKDTYFIVKTEELEKILVKSTACGLASNYIITDDQLKDIESKKKEADDLKKKELESIKKQKQLVKIGNVTSDDVIKFIPANEKIPAGYEEVVTDKKTHDALIKAALSSIKEKDQQQKYLDEIEQNQKDLFKKNMKEAEPVDAKPVVHKEEKKIDVKTDNTTGKELESVDVTSLFESEKKEEKKLEESKKMEEIVTEKPIDSEKQVVEPIVHETKKDSKKEIILDKNKKIKTSGSVIKDALDLNL